MHRQRGRGFRPYRKSSISNTFPIVSTLQRPRRLAWKRVFLPELFPRAVAAIWKILLAGIVAFRLQLLRSRPV